MAAGQGVLLADPARTQQLESTLASLAPRLGALTVQLRATVLPAMRLLGAETATNLQVSRVTAG